MEFGTLGGKLRSVILPILVALSIGVLVTAAVISLYQMPNHTEVSGITFFVGDVAPASERWTNGTVIDWGMFSGGESKTMLFCVRVNNATGPVTIKFLVSKPVGWLYTYSLNGTAIPIQPDKWYNGTVTLTAPALPTVGAVDFVTKVEVTS